MSDKFLSQKLIFILEILTLRLFRRLIGEFLRPRSLERDLDRRCSLERDRDLRLGSSRFRPLERLLDLDSRLRLRSSLSLDRPRFLTGGLKIQN